MGCSENPGCLEGAGEPAAGWPHRHGFAGADIQVSIWGGMAADGLAGGNVVCVQDDHGLTGAEGQAVPGEATDRNDLEFDRMVGDSHGVLRAEVM